MHVPAPAKVTSSRLTASLGSAVFHALTSSKSLLQEAVSRVADHPKIPGMKVAAPSFVCAAADEGMIRSQCAAENMAPHKIILEPMGRNTAPVAAIISHVIESDDPDGLILLLPADHHIANTAEFWRCVMKGISAAKAGNLTTLGIQAAHPETGYGYIRRGEAVDEEVYAVDAFVEKPDQATAQDYIADGRYYWNAGIFLFAARAMIEAFKTLAPDILADCQAAIENGDISPYKIGLDSQAFAKCRSDSIDYVIMEKASKVAVIAPVSAGWSDIGSWAAVRDMSEATHGDVITLDCESSYIRSEGPLVAAVGLKDMIVVSTSDAVLIIPSDRAQDVKAIVEQLKTTGRSDLL